LSLKSYKNSEKRRKIIDHLKAGGKIKNVNTGMIFHMVEIEIINVANKRVSTRLTKDVWEIKND